MGDIALIKKLGIKPGQQAAVVNPPDGYADRVGPPQGVEMATELDGAFDSVQVFAKVPTDLNRDVFWEALEHLGVRPVTQVSVDEVWSALRFRPFAAVGSR